MQGLVKRLLLGGIAGKVLGVLRELVAAWCLGTGLVANAYRLAQAAFLLPLHGFVSDAINGAFTPRYARLRVDDPDEAQRLFVAMQQILLIAGVAVAAALMFWAEHLVALMAPGFSAEARQLSAQYVMVLALALPAYVLVGLYGATELVHGQGTLVAARASVQSVGLLLGTLAAWALNRPLLIAVGFVTAYLGLLVWAALVNRKLGLRLTGRVGPASLWGATLKPVARVFAVLIWVPLALQVSQVVERRTASGLDVNAVAALDYARFITETLLILIAMPFGVAGQAAMPTMTDGAFRREALRATTVLVVVGLPLSAFIWAHAQLIVSVLFQRGAFTQASVAVTAQILGAYALGVVFLLVAYAGQKFLNARGQNGMVLRSTVLGVGAAVVCNLFLGRLLGVAVLGAAAALSGLVMMVLVLHALGLTRAVWQRTWTWWVTAVLHVLIVCIGRELIAPAWWIELLTGLVFWLLVVAAVRPQRELAVQAWRMLSKRGGNVDPSE
ncbi:hypothetical protein DBR42_08215 [Pelomonas sp. HMWF004]|nr:hypothetical protein DBR42_08215 [Pelomonas sp. HMWF004]